MSNISNRPSALSDPSKISIIRSYGVVFAAATFFLFSFINLNSFDALNQTLRAFYHVNALSISNLSAMYFYANIIFMIPAGLLLDRFSTRKLLLTVMLISILATLIFTWGDELWAAILSRFIMGATSTFCLLSTAKLTSRWFSPNHSASVMGWVVTMAMLGGILAQQLPSLIQLTGSWQSTMTAIALLGFVFWLLILIFVRDNPPHRENTHKTEQAHLKKIGFWKTLGPALINSQTWIAGVYTNLLTLPIVVMGALWVKDYVVTVFHETTGQAELAASLIFLGVLVGCPLAGIISDKIKRRRLPMLVGAVLTLLTAVFLLSERSLSPFEIGLDFFLMGLFSGSQVITYALVIESNPKNTTALSEAIASMIIMSAGAIFQPLFGYLLEKNWDGKTIHGAALYSANNFHDALWLLPLAFGVSVLLSLFIKETYCRPTH